MGSAAAGREDKKVVKYSNLSENYHFLPVGIETYGAYGTQAIKLITQIGKKYRKRPVKNFLLFISSRVSQWQYKKAMPSVLGAAPKRLQQA